MKNYENLKPISLDELEMRILQLKHKIENHISDVERLIKEIKEDELNSSKVVRVRARPIPKFYLKGDLSE